MNEIYFQIFKADENTLLWWGMCLRGIIIFLFSLFLVIIGGKRMFSKLGAFDVIVGLLLGAILAKAITGSARFFPTLLTSLTIVVLYRILALITYHSHFWGKIIKGYAQLLVKDGMLVKKNMRQNNISIHDLSEALRSKTNLKDLSEVKEAYIERNGTISFVTQPDADKNEKKDKKKD
jgi:uncharacterized membrane protein YcaP (DUF421 family)